MQPPRKKLKNESSQIKITCHIIGWESSQIGYSFPNLVTLWEVKVRGKWEDSHVQPVQPGKAERKVPRGHFVGAAEHEAAAWYGVDDDEDDVHNSCASTIPLREK